MADDLQTVEVKKVIRTTKKKKKVTIEGDPIQSESRTNSIDQGADREVRVKSDCYQTSKLWPLIVCSGHLSQDIDSGWFFRGFQIV